MHLWPDRFDGSLDNIFELQDQVAVSVAGVIHLHYKPPNPPIERATDKRSNRLRSVLTQHRARSCLEQGSEPSRPRPAGAGDRARSALRSRPRASGVLSFANRLLGLGRGSRAEPAPEYRACPAGAAGCGRRPHRPCPRSRRAGKLRRGYRAAGRPNRPVACAQSGLRLWLDVERLDPRVRGRSESSSRAFQDRTAARPKEPGKRLLSDRNRKRPFLGASARRGCVGAAGIATAAAILRDNVLLPRVLPCPYGTP